jgi:hypothetical protein
MPTPQARTTSNSLAQRLLQRVEAAGRAETRPATAATGGRHEPPLQSDLLTTILDRLDGLVASKDGPALMVSELKNALNNMLEEVRCSQVQNMRMLLEPFNVY